MSSSPVASKAGRILIFTAPSGAGKTTIVRHLLKHFPQLAFSVSATTRPPRPGEVDGKDYYFLSKTAFYNRVLAGDFVEWEEVYPGRFYGTLRSEIERLWALGKAIIFDIEVKGATNIKKDFPN
ncbi:MAG: guanylate kinase, partial [Bacteroidota bacterium]